MARTKWLPALCVLVAACGSVPSAARAKPPSWMLPPYHFYTLTYEATTAFEGTSIASYPVPIQLGEEVETLCERPETSVQLDGQMHARVRIGFVFGRYRYHGRTYVLSAHRALGHSAGGFIEEAGSRAVPAGCPSGSVLYLRRPWTCHYRYKEGEAPQFDLHASHQLRRWRAEISPVINSREEAGACQGEPDEWAGDYGGIQVVEPSTGSISYTIGGILAGRTFRGRVASDPAGARSGEGITPQAEKPSSVDPQSIWRSQVEVHASLTMAPVHRHRK